MEKDGNSGRYDIRNALGMHWVQ